MRVFAVVSPLVLIVGLIAGSAHGSTTCQATPVRTVGNVAMVRSGAVTGYIAAGHDIVRGRFSLHVGPWRVQNSLSQKIPWFLREDAPAGSTLVVSALRITPRPQRRFEQTFDAALGGDVYPSTISPPSAGCWRLTMRTGDVVVQFTAVVRK